jgi:undecaprenyl-diphosphatase
MRNLSELDQKVFLALNHFSAPGIDPVMRFLSGWIPWILFIAGFLLVILPKSWKRDRADFFIAIAVMLVTYISTEFSSVHLFKEVFMRLRPCHEPDLAGQVRLVADSCGGQFGFVSSHASNAFGMAVLSSFIVKRKWFTLCALLLAFLISYSRIYVGVHYPGDVLGGMLLGTFLGFAGFGWTKIIGYWRDDRGIKRKRLDTVRTVRMISSDHHIK